MKTKLILLTILLSTFLFNQCTDKYDLIYKEKSGGLDNLTISSDFKFSTTNSLSLSVTTLDNSGNPVPGIRLNIYNDFPVKGGARLISGITNTDGIYSSELKLLAGTDSIVVGTDAIGFVNLQKVKVTGSRLSIVLGGNQINQETKLISDINSKGKVFFNPIGEYYANGVPAFLEKTNDVIDAQMLEDINASLPERMPLTESNPDYLLESNETNLVLNDECNVWVTFVHEGAGYKNSLMYYTYEKGNEPKNVNDIDTLNVIFPNVSFLGSGGGLVSGNKVHLGTFAPGTVIGWALAANGYDGKWVTQGNGLLYSNQEFNPEKDTEKLRHTILINDIGREIFLLSFEDIVRNGSSDEDFNDAVFYVTADPVQAVDASNIPLPSYTSNDKDNDDISDNFDDYPDDPAKAFNNYYPSEGNYGTLAFEDLWPAEGDYDFNDLVIDYNYNQITNGKNEVVQIVASLTLKASGAGFKNGFGFELPVNPEDVLSVSGSSLTESIVKNESNGTESGQKYATVVVFDNAFNELKFPGGYATGINTTNGAPYAEPKTFTITIDLTKPVSLRTMGVPPYNPFMIVDRNRSREVHLIDHSPTNMADRTLFGTEDDNTIEGSGRFYVTRQNLPFAIDLAGGFDYPSEKNKITLGYSKFEIWGITSGKSFYDWYKPLNGYRNSEFLFKR